LKPGFLNIAHRGGGKLAPEETQVAYQNAIQVGADVIECDAHSTADGVVVCMHDDTVDRTTNGKGTIQSMTFASLRALDAGYAFSPDGGTSFPYRGKGLQVASLDEFLQVHPTVGLSIEIKQADPPIGPQVVQAIVAHGALDRTVLIAFFDDTMAQVRALEPRLTTGLALGEMLALSTLQDADEATYLPPARVIQAPTNQMDPQLLVARAHRLGMKVQFWTINDAKQMSALVAMGADGIFTDDPATLHAVVSAP
jgi:glycerophosphoryl diester phosphodiesterase